MLLPSTGFLFSVVLIVLGYITILNYIGFFRSTIYLKREIFKLNHQNIPSNLNPRIHIFIPVLNESEVIQQSVVHFTKLKGNYSLHYITTEKERKRSNGQNKTKEKLERLRAKGFDFDIIHYPYQEGVMAHQLNFALNELLKNKKTTRRDYVLVYNVDSRVHTKLILDLVNYIKLKKYPEIIHQPALFLDNYKAFDNIKGILLKNIALLQSRWTLVHEIPRILSAGSKNKIIRSTESGHLVGHGMMLRVDLLKEIGGFFTQYTNEDLPMGYVLANSGKSIHIFPYLENAESPRNIKQVVRQYTTWYYGASGYLSYTRDFLHRIQKISFRPLFTGIKNQVRAIMWLFAGVFWFLAFFVPLLITPSFWYYSVLFFIVFTIQHTIIYFLLKSCILPRQLDNFNNSKSYPITFLQILINPFSYILHTFGPIRASYRMFLSKMLQKNIVKEKTER